MVVTPAFDDLRRHLRRRTQHSVGERLHRLLLRETEVDQLDLSVAVNDHVVWLEVSVQNPSLVHLPHRYQQLLHLEGLFFEGGQRAGSVFEGHASDVEGSALDLLRQDLDELVVFAGVDLLDDVGVV